MESTLPMKPTISCFLITTAMASDYNEQDDRHDTKIDPILVMSWAFLIFFLFVLFYSLDRKSVVNSITNNTPTLANECPDLTGIVVQSDNTNQISPRQLSPENLIEKYSASSRSKSLVSNSETLELVNEKQNFVEHHPLRIVKVSNGFYIKNNCNRDSYSNSKFESIDTTSTKSLRDIFHTTSIDSDKNIGQIEPIENLIGFPQCSENCLFEDVETFEYAFNTPVVCQIQIPPEIKPEHIMSKNKPSISNFKKNFQNHQVQNGTSRGAEWDDIPKNMRKHLQDPGKITLQRPPYSRFSQETGLGGEIDANYDKIKKSDNEYFYQLGKRIETVQKQAKMNIYMNSEWYDITKTIQEHTSRVNEFEQKYYQGAANTSSFKKAKMNLNPSLVSDNAFFQTIQKYQEVVNELRQKISQGSIDILPSLKNIDDLYESLK